MSGNKKEEALIHVQGLGKSFGAVDVLKDISVDINKGDVVFVIGPSGSGKSTFLRCLNRLEEPTRGHAAVRARGAGRPCPCLSQPAFRRTEAANRYCESSLHEAGCDAL